MVTAKLRVALPTSSKRVKRADRMMGFLNQLRCRLAYRLAHCGHPKGLGLGLLIAPDTTSLIRHRSRHAPVLQVPERSHLIYHQQTVDRQAALNSLRSMRDQIPMEDEILFLDVGGTMSAEVLGEFGPHEWVTYSSAKAALPEQQSYTFGMNLGMRMLKGEQLFVWRTDYVYPADLMARYLRHLETADFACPYGVLVGDAAVTGEFVADHWDKVRPFDEKFWEARSHPISLYETQDPALFGISRRLWEKIGGLNHQLWGYGWQFAELAARVRGECRASKVVYFGGTPPLHQTHVGTLMHIIHQPVEGKWSHVESGNARFTEFLGGPEAYWTYRCKQLLLPRTPVE